jgi:hypothetical protein
MGIECGWLMPDTIMTDALGRRVVLHDHTWHGHIVKRHPEMRLHRRITEQAIVNSIEIRISDADPDCRLYFGHGPRAGIMVAVIVDLSRSFVKTAHLVKKAKGVVEWSRLTP